MNDEQKISIIKTVFNRLHAPNHPLSINLAKMQEIEEIRIIEGLDK